MGRGVEQTFSKDKKLRWQKGTEKGAQHHYQGNATGRILPHICKESLLSKTQRNNKCWRAYEKRPWVNCWWKCKLVWPEGKTVWSCSEN